MPRLGICIFLSIGVILAGLFVRSLFIVDSICWFRPSGMSWSLDSDFGGLDLIGFHVPDASRPRSAMLERWSTHVADMPPSYQRYHQQIWCPDLLVTSGNVFVDVPMLPVALGCVGCGSFLIWRGARGRRRAKRGLCPKCGYDLRATPERCPECGTAGAEPGRYSRPVRSPAAIVGRYGARPLQNCGRPNVAAGLCTGRER